jgi:hypothetical protein
MLQDAPPLMLGSGQAMHLIVLQGFRVQDLNSLNTRIPFPRSGKMAQLNVSGKAICKMLPYCAHTLNPMACLAGTYIFLKVAKRTAASTAGLSFCD